MRKRRGRRRRAADGVGWRGGFVICEGRDQFSVIKHLVVPIFGIVAMVIGFVSALGGVTIPIINAKIPALGPPFSYAPPIVGIWAIVGIVLFFVLRTRNPQATDEIGAAVAEA